MTSGRSIVVQGSAEGAEDVVVFLPPAGSVTSPYFGIGDHLPAALPAAHCEMPGRGRLAHRVAPTSVPDAVDRWVDDLVALLPGRRLHLFGHSLGALFAYELATRFEEPAKRGSGGGITDCRVAGLIVSGARDPAKPARTLVSTAFAALRGEQRGGGEGDDQGAWLLGDLRMRREYRMPGLVLRAPIALLAGRSDAFVRPDEMEEWKQWTSGPLLGTFAFDGGHEYYRADPASVAVAIERVVTRARQHGNTF